MFLALFYRPSPYQIDLENQFDAIHSLQRRILKNTEITDLFCREGFSTRLEGFKTQQEALEDRLVEVVTQLPQPKELEQLAVECSRIAIQSICSDAQTYVQLHDLNWENHDVVKRHLAPIALEYIDAFHQAVFDKTGKDFVPPTLQTVSKAKEPVPSNPEKNRVNLGGYSSYTDKIELNIHPDAIEEIARQAKNLKSLSMVFLGVTGHECTHYLQSQFAMLYGARKNEVPKKYRRDALYNRIRENSIGTISPDLSFKAYELMPHETSAEVVREETEKELDKILRAKPLNSCPQLALRVS